MIVLIKVITNILIVVVIETVAIKLTHNIYIYELILVDKYCVYGCNKGKRKHLLCVKWYFESYNNRYKTKYIIMLIVINKKLIGRFITINRQRIYTKVNNTRGYNFFKFGNMVKHI